MSEQDSPKVELTPVRRVLLDLSPPKSAHLISWTRAGSQILLEVGYFDLRSIHEQAQPAFEGERALEWFITDRFILDVPAAQRVCEQFAQLGAHLALLRPAEGKEEEDGSDVGTD